MYQHIILYRIISYTRDFKKYGSTEILYVPRKGISVRGHTLDEVFSSGGVGRRVLIQDEGNSFKNKGVKSYPCKGRCLESIHGVRDLDNILN